jgi:hypothetical protein
MINKNLHIINDLETSGNLCNLIKFNEFALIINYLKVIIKHDK